MVMVKNEINLRKTKEADEFCCGQRYRQKRISGI